jgi:hypothetical protein
MNRACLDVIDFGAKFIGNPAAARLHAQRHPDTKTRGTIP